jgi:hypothetical protein
MHAKYLQTQILASKYVISKVLADFNEKALAGAKAFLYL